MTASTQNRDAYGARRPIGRRLRRLGFDFTRVYQKLFGRRPAGDHLHIVGDVEGVEARLNWYLANPTVPLVGLERHQSLANAESDHGLDPDLVHAHPASTDEPAGKAHVVLTDKMAGSIRAVLRDPKHVTLVSPSLYASADTSGYLRLRGAFAPGAAADEDESWPTRALEPDAVDWAVVVATGPSVDGFDFTGLAAADVRVTCNSAIRNLDLLRTFRPNVLCFGDPVFHFGPSRYARAFRDDLENALELLPDLIVVVPEHFRSLLHEHVTAARGRTIGHRLTRSAPVVPSRQQGAHVRRTGNVLTQHMLPMALQHRPRRLSLVGCDGRQKRERYFWQHGQAVQYSDDLMASVFECHPAFFRDVSYADYYGRHCREVARWVALATDAGCRLDTLTPSHIPVLTDRAGLP